jgi:hypothetical protein
LKFDSQLGNYLKQSETKDQTGKGAKIKGSNYNFSRGLDYKIAKKFNDQIRSIFLNFETAPFLGHYSLSLPCRAVFSSKG